MFIYFIFETSQSYNIILYISFWYRYDVLHYFGNVQLLYINIIMSMIKIPKCFKKYIVGYLF